MSFGGANLGAGTGILDLDISGFAAGGRQAIATLQSVERQGSVLSRSMGALGGAFAAPQRAMSAFSGGLGSLVAGLGGVGLAAGGLTAIVTGVVGVTNALVGGNAEMETYVTQFSTLLGSTEAAQARLAELAKFGAETPFELPEIARAEKILLGFGLTGEKALRMTQRSGTELRTIIGDIAAGTGASFEEIALSFGKFSAGATGEAIARFQELGIVTREQMTELGIQFSKSGELVSPLPQALTAAVNIANSKFGGGMKNLSATFSGQVSTLKDNIAAGVRRVTEPLFGIARDAVAGLNGIIGSEGFQASLSTLASVLATGVARAMELLTAGFKAAQPVVLAFGSALIGIVTGDASQVSAGLARLDSSIRPIAANILNMIRLLQASAGFGVEVFRVFSGGATTFAGVRVAVGSLLEAFRQMTGIDLTGLAGPLTEGVRLIRDGVTSARDAVSTFLGALQGNWQPAPGITTFHTIVGSIGQTIGFVRDGVVTFLGALQGNWQPAPGISRFHELMGVIGIASRTVIGEVSRFIQVLTGDVDATSLTESERAVSGIGAAAGAAIQSVTSFAGAFRPFEVISGILNTTADAILNLIGFVQQNQGVIGTFASAVTGAAIAFQALSAAQALYVGVTTGLPALLGLVSAAQAALNVIMTANPIGLIVVALGALAGGLIYAYNNIEPFRNAVDALWAGAQQAGAAIMAFASDVATAVGPAVSQAAQAVQQFGPLVLALFTNLPGLVTAALATFGPSIASALGGAIQTGLQAAGGVLPSLAASMVAPLLAVWGAVPEDIRADIDLIVTTVVGRLGGLVGQVIGFMGGILSGIQGAWASATGATADATATIQSSSVNAFQGVLSAAQSNWPAIQGFVLTAMAAMLDVLVPGMGTMLKATVENWDQVVSTTQTTWTTVSTTISEFTAQALATVTAWASNLYSQISGLAGQVIGAAQEIGQAIVNGIRDGIANTGAALKTNIANVVRGWLGQAKAALDISSPSGVARREIGIPMGQGAMLGMEEGFDPDWAFMTEGLPEAVASLRQYFHFVQEDGDTLNDFLTHIPEGWRQAAKDVADFLEGNTTALATFQNYLDFVVEEGDVLNDYLAGIPQEVQQSALNLGRFVSTLMEEAKVDPQAIRSGITDPLVAGLAQGLQASGPRFTDAIEGLVEGATLRASQALQNFQDLAGPIFDTISAQAEDQTRRLVGTLGQGAVQAYNEARASINGLESAIVLVDDQIKAHNQSIRRWERVLEEAEGQVTSAEEEVRRLGEALSDAQGDLDRFSGGDIPLPGERESERRQLEMQNALNILEAQRARLLADGADSEDKRVQALDAEIERHRLALDAIKAEAKAQFDTQRELLRQTADRRGAEQSFEEQYQAAAEARRRVEELENQQLPQAQERLRLAQEAAAATERELEAEKARADQLQEARAALVESRDQDARLLDDILTKVRERADLEEGTARSVERQATARERQANAERPVQASHAEEQAVDEQLRATAQEAGGTADSIDQTREAFARLLATIPLEDIAIPFLVNAARDADRLTEALVRSASAWQEVRAAAGVGQAPALVPPPSPPPVTPQAASQVITEIIRVEYSGTIAVEGRSLDGTGAETIGSVRDLIDTRVREGQIELVERLTQHMGGRRR